MGNKYTEGAASVLLHKHLGDPHFAHGPNSEFSKPEKCPECQSGADDIETNGLPAHHVEFTCQCLSCGFEWMPNSDE